MSAWQSIETAPKYEAVLVFIPNAEHYGHGIYRALLGEFGWTSTGRHVGRSLGVYDQPTHWMPLPTPPAEETDPR